MKTNRLDTRAVLGAYLALAIVAGSLAAACGDDADGDDPNVIPSTGGKSSTGGGGGAGGKPKTEPKGGGGGTTATTTTTTKAAETLAELDRTRDERRRATITRLRERWGSLLDSEAARGELKLHAERVARLARIRSLAVDKKKLSMIESVDGLVTKEELRHGSAMNALRASGGKP